MVVTAAAEPPPAFGPRQHEFSRPPLSSRPLSHSASAIPSRGGVGPICVAERGLADAPLDVSRPLELVALSINIV